MARDEALFSLYPEKNVPTFRVYQWDGPCLSLGHFQKPEEVLFLDEVRARGIPFVRRMTGGAVILHHREITYSICLNCRDLDLDGSVKDSFRKITSFLFTFYRSLGLEAVFASEIARDRVENCGAFCFSTCEPFDIMVKNKKIGGNAQKRNRHYILQHGSIPLEIDFDLLGRLVRGIPGNIAERTHGLYAALEDKPDLKTLIALLTRSFLDTFGVEKIPIPFSSEEGVWVMKLLNTKYAMEKKDWPVE